MALLTLCGRAAGCLFIGQAGKDEKVNQS
ncbi:hypothetical protein B14911_04639 [Bacillus sp. NRRL B-14911]|nr:hypothetical protein B14911_04639 [Bacillus sp. NRRL B-14911]